MNCNGEGFEGRIGDEKGININRRKLKVMADEDCEAPTATARTIPPKQCVPRERRIRHMGTKFSLLDTCHFDMVVMEERREFSLRGVDTVNVYLKDARNSRRWLTTRTLRTLRLLLLRLLLLSLLSVMLLPLMMLLRAGIRGDAGDEEEEEDLPTSKSF